MMNSYCRPTQRTRRHLAGMLAAVGLFAAALGGASPVAAAPLSQAECQSHLPAGVVAVEAVGISQGQTITLWQQPDQVTFVGPATLHVFCYDPNTDTRFGDVSGATVNVQIQAAASQPGVTFNINGTPGPVAIGPFDGTATITLSTNSPKLNLALQPLGSDIATVVGAWGGPLTDPTTNGAVLAPGTQSSIIAKTPELDSVLLFATGATGIVGYALLRRRARRSGR